MNKRDREKFRHLYKQTAFRVWGFCQTTVREVRRDKLKQLLAPRGYFLKLSKKGVSHE
jgi:hypothetical protein